MILVLGQRNDASTIDVIEWLMYYGKEFVVLYTEDENFKIIRFNPDKREFIIKTNEQMVNLYDVTAVWNRRRGISIKLFDKEYLKDDEQQGFFMEPGDREHYEQLHDESAVLIMFIHYFMETEGVTIIGSYFKNEVNKLIVLKKAVKYGLDIPKTRVLTQKKDLYVFLEEVQPNYIITKAACEGVYRTDVRNKYLYYSYVERLTKETIEKYPESFYPSLLQEEIKKDLEIRSFFFMDKFYSMAIFSQDEEEAIVDFRKNDHRDKPLKFVPYKLTNEIEKKLILLMHDLELNTGSIDLVLGEDGKYYFLEVNPCGQYRMTSDPCNYYLDRLIAKTL